MFEKVPEESSKVISDIRKNEEEVESLISQYENEMKALEIKYDKLIQERLRARKEKAKSLKNFWLTALSNHRLFKDFIATSDIDILRYLEDVSYEKLEGKPEDNVRFHLN